MNINKLDIQEFDNIKVWQCSVTALDRDNQITLTREIIVEENKTYPIDDVIKIEGGCSYDVDDERTISFPTDSISILATALQLMIDES